VLREKTGLRERPLRLEKRERTFAEKKGESGQQRVKRKIAGPYCTGLNGAIWPLDKPQKGEGCLDRRQEFWTALFETEQCTGERTGGTKKKDRGPDLGGEHSTLRGRGGELVHFLRGWTAAFWKFVPREKTHRRSRTKKGRLLFQGYGSGRAESSRGKIFRHIGWRLPDRDDG